MKYFGTDGIRDRVEGPLLQELFVRRLGVALGRWLKAHHSHPASPHAIIGRDTRFSGTRLFYLLAEGLHSEGIRIFDGGMVPTPAIALAVAELDLDLGIAVTASHNPASDNGIKLIGPGGRKLTEVEENELETFIDGVEDTLGSSLVPPPVMLYDARRHYLERIRKEVTPNLLIGKRIALDTAHGPTAFTSAEIFAELGAQLVCRGNDPDGHNINAEVGSEYVHMLAARFDELPVDLAVAHDGDGDRVIFIDEAGKVVDGDALMAVIASHWLLKGRLRDKTLVATIVSNAGLDVAMRRMGGQLVRSGVGDRNVYLAMEKGGFNLGGESSGHFILKDFLPTGDGLVAALEVFGIMAETGKSLNELTAVYEPSPQAKVNLRVSSQPPLENFPDLYEAIAELEASLGEGGRILLRYSGTEARVRLIVEAAEKKLADRSLEQLTALVRRHLPVF